MECHSRRAWIFARFGLSKLSLALPGLALLGLPLDVAAAAESGSKPALPRIIVGDQALTARDFEEALQIVTQRRYFHGNAPAHMQDALRSEAREALIDRTLLLGEARRRKLPQDVRAADAAMVDLDRRYRGARDWPEKRRRIRQRLIEDGLIDALHEQERRAVVMPDETQVRAYYQKNPAAFTEPARQRVAAILLGVEPSAPAQTWGAARAEAAKIREQLRKGGDFGAIARARSTDASAASGGDMGYLHRGMLPEPAQQAIDVLKPGEVTDPLTLLNGVALLKLLSRQPAKLLPYAEVRERAQQLWVRDAQERRAQQLIQRLRANTPIRIAALGGWRGEATSGFGRA